MNEAIHSYEASAFHPDLGNNLAVGRITLDRWHLRFESATATLEIPLARLQARTGEGDDDRIIFTDPANPQWEVYTTDERILEHPGLAAVNAIREQLSREATRREVVRRVKQLAWVAGVGLLVVVLGQLAVSAMVRSLVARLPASVEQAIGDQAITELQEEMEFLQNSNRVAHLAALAQPLMSTLKLGTNVQFYIVQESDPNAFALPGGHVIFTTGMLELCDRPEQALAVLAHEFAHVTRQHGIRKAVSAAGPFLILRVFLGGGGLSDMLGGASDLLIRSSFSQAYETEADDEGWRMLVAARIDPQGMRESFEKLLSHERARGHGADLPEAFASHPALPKRISRLEKKWQQAGGKREFADLARLKPHLLAAAGH